MPDKRITEVLRTGKILVSDGGWGTFMHQKGLRPGECPEHWCLTRFDDVKDIARRYIEVGADMTQTNSFGGTCCKLGHFGLADKTAEINEAAARASREAAGPDRWVIASAGPTGQMLITEDITEEEMFNAFKTQVTALEKGGADAVCIETMSDIEEAVLAIKVAKEHTKLEVICTFTFEKTARGEYRTMMGVSPAKAAKACVEAGADIIGTNCGNGIERMVEIVKEIKTAAPEAFVLVHANAGLPEVIEKKTVFPDTPEDMAKFVPALIGAGANVIGGCCGTTPEHIRAVKEAVSPYRAE
jgi:5-methyltetrahydrofolate--homocysteine methyltransferase